MAAPLRLTRGRVDLPPGWRKMTIAWSDCWCFRREV